MKNKLVVLVDIDNILNNFSEVCIRLFNKNHNTEHKLENITTYDLCSSFNYDDRDDFINNYLLSEEVSKQCTPLKNAVKYLEMINNVCSVYIVTARDWKQLTNIMDWFNKYFPFIKDTQLIRCVNKDRIRGDILIDDNLDNILNFSGGRILFDYGWNRNVEDVTHFINRVHNWEECWNIINLILKPNKGDVKV